MNSIDTASLPNADSVAEVEDVDSTQKERARLEEEEQLLLWLKSFIQHKQAEKRLPPGPAGIHSLSPAGISFDLAEDQYRLDQVRHILPQAITPGSYHFTLHQIPPLTDALEAKLLQVQQTLYPRGSQPFSPKKDVEALEPILVRLNDLMYEKHGKEIDKHVQAIRTLNNDMEKLIQLTQLIQRKKTENGQPGQKNDGSILLTSEEDKAVIDAAQTLIPQALKAHTYTLTKDESDALLHSIDLKVKQLSNEITPHTSYMTEAFDNRKNDVERFYKLLERYERLKDNIIRNFKS